MRAFSPESLAAFGTRRPWLVVGAWVVILVASVFAATGLGAVLSTEADVFVNFEARQADDLIDANFGRSDIPDQEYVVVQSSEYQVADRAFQTIATSLAANLAAAPSAVGGVVNYYETGDESLVSNDRKTLLMPVFLAGGTEDSAEVILEIVREAAGDPAFVIATGGPGSIDIVSNETTERDLRTAEMFGLPVALVVLIVVFGAAVAAGLPIILGLLGIVVALGITATIGRAWELSFFVTNMIFMIGLAVGIDYTLLVIQRFREERRRGLERDAAIVKAGGTASRAVLFSGMAVIVALSGLLIVPDSIFRSLAIGAIVVVVAAIAASLTLLPALLRLFGDRVNLGRVRIPRRKQSEGGQFWTWAVHTVMARPVVSMTLATVALLAAATPYLGVQLGFAGAASLPANTEPGIAFRILEQEFNAGVLTPFKIVIDGEPGDPVVEQGIEQLTALLADDGRFDLPSRQDSPGGHTILIETAVNGDPQGDEAFAALDQLRGEYVPAAFGRYSDSVFVGGQTGWVEDYADMIGQYTPWVFTFVLGLSFVILLLVFRSIVVPVKAIIMNLLSVGAAYGILVLVFQDGVGADLLGFTKVERIESWVPLFMFAILFGLSMDYHVFLLTRIRERFDQTGDNRESVAYGVRATAGLITGAAAIMVAVFSGFAMGEIAMMQQFGFGLAVAITLDATIVRVVLVPATMALLGSANWYLPAWLEWLPTIHVDGASDVAGDRDHGVPGIVPAGDPAG